MAHWQGIRKRQIVNSDVNFSPQRLELGKGHIPRHALLSIIYNLKNSAAVQRGGILSFSNSTNLDQVRNDARSKSLILAEFSLRTRDFTFTMRRTRTRAKDIIYPYSKTFPRAKNLAHDKAYGFHLTYGHCNLEKKYVKV